MWGGKKKRKDQWNVEYPSSSGSSGVSKSDINDCIRRIKNVSTFGILGAFHYNGTIIVNLAHDLTDTQYWNIENICSEYGFGVEYK